MTTTVIGGGGSDGGMGRPTSPDSARQIWSQIDQMAQRGELATVDNIAQGMGHYLEWVNWNMDEVRVKIYEAVDSGLLRRSTASVDNPTPVFTIPIPEPGEPEHDWYCFECHSSGPAIPCTTCFRIYHLSCLSVPVDDRTFICPVCQSLEAPCGMDEESLSKQLGSILTWVHRKGGAGFALPSGSMELRRERYRLLIARDIDLGAMKTKLNTQRYPTPRHFLADFQLLIHNICILHGKNGNLSRLAEELFKEVKEEIITLESDQDAQISEAIMHLEDGRGPVKRQRKSPEVSSPKRRRVSGPAVTTKTLEDEALANEAWAMDDGFKKLLMDLQRHWLIEYQQSREKLLVDLTEKLHQEFLSDQQKIRTELLTQFKDELDATRQELEQKYRDTLKQELQKMGEKHRKDIANTKKKQWCWQCEAEAIYHCCWNTAYCSVDCQQAHWPTHRKYCRRKKGAPGGAPGQN